MSEIFKHVFSRAVECDARRWVNKDGSVGGIAAVSAQVHPTVILTLTAEVGHKACIGNGAFIGAGACIGAGVIYDADDWLYAAGPQGSRNAWATATWSQRYGLRWWVGCQRGISTEVLRERITRDHPGTDHEADYLHLIDTVERHPGLARAIAASSTSAGGAHAG